MQDEKTSAYLSAASERFRQIFADVEAIVMKRFPQANATFIYEMPGWKVPLPEPARSPGTMDPNAVYILLVERKAGITLHLMNPLDYHYLDTHKEELSGAGFKVMRGCLQFQRKAAYPSAAVERLLQALPLHAAE